jgi:hypothetical protein
VNALGYGGGKTTARPVERRQMRRGPVQLVWRFCGEEGREERVLKALTPKLDHLVSDRDPEVEMDARAIQVLRQRVPVVAFVNNHYAGYAPETVRQLVALADAAASM